MPNPAQLLLYAAYRLFQSRRPILEWKNVEQWIQENSSPNLINRGYTSGNARTGQSTFDSFVELRRDQKGDDCVRVTAVVYFDKRHGAFRKKTWEGGKLDGELTKLFGKNLRARIRI